MGGGGRGIPLCVECRRRPKVNHAVWEMKDQVDFDLLLEFRKMIIDSTHKIFTYFTNIVNFAQSELLTISNPENLQVICT